MDVHISFDRGERTAGIYRQLRDAVLDGRLRTGERLLPTRELARRLEVSRNTVAVAYEQLTAEGFLVSRVGAGTFVRPQLVAPGRRRSAPSGTGVQPRRVWATIPGRPPAGAFEPTYDFRLGVPDARLFPHEMWRRLVVAGLRDLAAQPAEYGDPAGHAGLRAAIARYAGISRSVRAGADDVVVTDGAQQALDLVARVLVKPGTCVAVEEPGYPSARHLFRSLGARVAGVPVDAEGLVVPVIPNSARLVYTTPTHQFPLGTRMSLGRRAALLAWAERHDAVVIEDDYDSEFRFQDRPLEPLQSLDRTGRVIYVGSFSKTMLPMLRLGFLVAPASLRTALHTARQLSDWHGDVATQAAMARFIDGGLLGRHIRRATREYASRRARIVSAFQGELGEWLELVPSVAGLHVCAQLRPGVALDVDRVVVRARRAGVAVESLADYCDEYPAPSRLLVGYGAIDPKQIEEGLRLLVESIREVAPQAPQH